MKTIDSERGPEKLWCDMKKEGMKMQAPGLARRAPGDESCQRSGGRSEEMLDTFSTFLLNC